MSEKDNNVMPLATDPHNLGEFDNVYDAMRRYPNGGVDGDYIYILGVQHFWNVNRQSWGILKDKEDNLVQMVEDFIGLFERRGYVFAGYALPDTTPVSGLDNIFYIAAKNGVYTHFGSDLKLSNEVAILRKPRRSSLWIKDSMDIPNSERIDAIDDAISRINVDIETIKSAIISMENDLDGVHDSIDDINKDIDAFKKETSENFEEVNSDLDKVEKRLDYIPKESFLSARPAGFKPDIDLTPEITVDRAWRDHEGNVIRDTYITRRGLRNEIIDITNQQVTDLKPGSVDPDDLSEATKQLIGNKSITNLPDEEDITVTDNQTLKLKDKEYAPKDYSGMGRVYLRKHYVNGVNTLTQHMMRKPNTIYIIQYDYCLAGQTIEVPENCVLQFEGGSLRNGILKGCRTKITSSTRYILKHIKIDGIFCGLYNINWFLEGYNLCDFDVSIFNLNLIFEENAYYRITEPKNVKGITNIHLNFNNSTIKFKDTVNAWTFEDCENIVIENFKLDISDSVQIHYTSRGINFLNCKKINVSSGEIYSLSDEEGRGRLGIGITNCKDVIFENVYSHDCIYGWPFYIDSVDTLNIHGCISDNCWDGIKLTGIVKNVLISGNILKNNIRDGIDFAGHCIDNYVVKNNSIIGNRIMGIETKTLDRNIYPLSKYGLRPEDVVFNNIFIENNVLVYEGTDKVELLTVRDLYSYERPDVVKTVSISNNTLRSSGSLTIGIAMSVISKIGFSVIENNLLEGFFERAIIVGAKGTTVKGNTILNSSIGIQLSRNDDNSNSILSDILIIDNIINSINNVINIKNNINVNDITCSSCYIYNNRIESKKGPVIGKTYKDNVRLADNYLNGSMRSNPASDPSFKTILLNLVVPSAIVSSTKSMHCSGWRCVSENPVEFEAIDRSKPYEELKKEDKGFSFFDKDSLYIKYFDGEKYRGTPLGGSSVQNIDVNELYKISSSCVDFYILSTDSAHINLPTSSDDGGFLLHKQRLPFDNTENSQLIHQTFFSLKNERSYTRFGRGNGSDINWGIWKISDIHNERRSNRPSLSSNEIGFFYYDTNLNKPIWWNGTNWIDATGATV